MLQGVSSVWKPQRWAKSFSVQAANPLKGAVMVTVDNTAVKWYLENK